jgi:hypothetical protein
LDLGAGLGRDACCLAEELLYHWNTTYPTLMKGKNSHHLPTNSRMALYDAVTSAKDNSQDQPLVEKYYRNTEHIPAESYNDPKIFQKNIVMPFIQYCWEEYPSTKMFFRRYHRYKLLQHLLLLVLSWIIKLI